MMEMTEYNPQTMTRRDYFAAAALQGLLASTGHRFSTFEEYSKCAFHHADAMIAAREEKP